MHQEIENVGVQLGRRIIDVMTKDMGNVHQTQLDIVKYLCVSFWPYVFGKQVDNLKKDLESHEKAMRGEPESPSRLPGEGGKGP